MLNEKPPRDHRADVVEEPGENHLENVNHDESDKRKTGNKVNRPCGLASSEDGQEPGERSIDRRRHRQTSQHNQRRHDEQDTGVGQLLKDVVPLGFFTAWMSQEQMISE